MLPNKENAIKIFFLYFGVFWPFFNQKTAKKIICQNPNRLMKFSEIWNVDASQQKKFYEKPFFGFGLFWSLSNQKTAKIDTNEENWLNPNRLVKFSEI